MLAILWIVGSTIASAWAFMIAVGVAHAQWLPMMPTIGYWPSLAIMALLGLAARLETYIPSND
jgi:hypothetical protein